MLKPLVAAAALAAVAAPAFASTPAVNCVNAFVYTVRNNPVRPLPYGGGGGEPHTPMPGDPVGYVKYDVTAARTAADCIV